MRLFPLILLIFTLIQFPTQAEPGGKDELEIDVMSFNIRYGAARDGENAWPHRQELVAETIQQRDPDLLGLQEALPFQVEFLASKLPEYTVYAVSRVEGEGGETCAVFYRTAMFEEVKKETFWLSESPEEPGSKSWDSSLPRIATWIMLQSRASEQKLLFLNTHFDHKGPIAREESAKLIRKKLSGFDENLPIILTGDFNCGEGSAPYQALMAGEGGYLDTYRQHIPEADPENEITFTGFGERYGSARIDWVLTSDACRTIDAGIDRYRKDGRFPSDHEPVYATVVLE